MSEQTPRRKSAGAAKATPADASPQAEAPPQASSVETGPTLPLARTTRPNGAASGEPAGSVPVHDAAEARQHQAPPAGAVHEAPGTQHPQPAAAPTDAAGPAHPHTEPQQPGAQPTGAAQPGAAGQYPAQPQGTTPQPGYDAQQAQAYGGQHPDYAAQHAQYAAQHPQGAPPPHPGYPPSPPPVLYDAYGRPVPATPPATLSITSMILSISGFLLLSVGIGLFASIAGVITGHLARKREPHARGFWLTGIIAGWIGVGISALVILGIIVAFLVAGTAAFIPLLYELGNNGIPPNGLD